MLNDVVYDERCRLADQHIAERVFMSRLDDKYCRVQRVNIREWGALWTGQLFWIINPPGLTFKYRSLNHPVYCFSAGNNGGAAEFRSEVVTRGNVSQESGCQLVERK
ncbi:hypothetical protein AVEN_86530-1 [Araneus ventricosus]|uniref:Uncharacterized protein n=1 Tax=Araneus ventricosus TaxID=182803 RepID=A0A4Y2HDI0_ARAVE|nr:hypothetical protein AVEN_238839-1 [Araneus ventricosus]GBM63329.1 hypothetical protein AVEN_86530-1 [Araneus ventricosus]